MEYGRSASRRGKGKLKGLSLYVITLSYPRRGEGKARAAEGRWKEGQAGGECSVLGAPTVLPHALGGS